MSKILIILRSGMDYHHSYFIHTHKEVGQYQSYKVEESTKPLKNNPGTNKKRKSNASGNVLCSTVVFHLSVSSIW